MALCTKCGAIFSDEDMRMNRHKCRPENIAVTGKEKLPVTTTSDVL
jgi:predicted  nucleic acid-binding Zn-ribbon protein